jgi:hypothetical protein
LDKLHLGARREDEAQAKQREEEAEGGHIRTPAYLISREELSFNAETPRAQR